MLVSTLMVEELINFLKGTAEFMWSSVNESVQAIAVLVWPIISTILAIPAPHLNNPILGIPLAEREAVVQVSPLLGVVVMLVVFGGIGVGLLVTIVKDKIHNSPSNPALS
jgi:hypothetical protein